MGRLVQWVVVAVVVLAGVFAGNWVDGGRVSTLIQPSAWLLVFGVALGALWMARSDSDLKDLANFLLGAKLPAERLEAVRRVGQSLGWIAPTAGAIGVASGLLLTVRTFDDPSRLGAGVAMAYLSVVYAAGVALFGIALLAGAEMNQERDDRPTPTEIASPVLAAVLLFGAAGLGILFEGGDWPVTASALLIFASAMGVPLAFDPKPMGRGRMGTRLRFMALSLVPAVVLASTFGAIHVMQNISYPSLLLPGLADSLSPVWMGLVLYVGLRAVAVRLDGDESEEPSRHLPAILGGIGGLSSIYGLFGLVVWACWLNDSVAAR
jgi:flagellar motor component MotA